MSWCPRLQEARISFAKLRLAPATLAEMISLIEVGAISGKIGKQILPDLLEVCGVSCWNQLGPPSSTCWPVLLAVPPSWAAKPCAARNLLQAASCISGTPELQVAQDGDTVTS